MKTITGIMTQEQFDTWLRELRNPDNKQARRALARKPGKNSKGMRIGGGVSCNVVNGVSFCCIGLFDRKLLPEETQNVAGTYSLPNIEIFGSELLEECIGLNDVELKTFPEIADHVEANWQIAKQ